MEKKYCNSCRRISWHNPSGKKDGSPRCTFCGSPVTTNPGKREYWETIRKHQSAKPVR
jgi:hypothetical protein